MKISGIAKVAGSLDVTKNGKEIAKILVKTFYAGTGGTPNIYFSLYSENPEHFAQLLELQKGDTILFSGANLDFIRYFLLPSGESASVMTLSMTHAEFLTNLDTARRKGAGEIVDQSTKKEEKEMPNQNGEDYGFSSDILTEDWQGINFPEITPEKGEDDDF